MKVSLAAALRYVFMRTQNADVRIYFLLSYHYLNI